MTKTFFNLSKTLTLVLPVAVVLGGCEMHSESLVTQNRVQLAQEEFSETMSVKDLDAAAIATLAGDYDRYGDGPVELTVLYDPSSKSATASFAGSEAARISAGLRKNGIRDIDTNIIPVRDYGDDAHAMIEYTAYSALAPKDCTDISGLNDPNLDIDPDYKLGCSVETVFAKQIARPKDLRGQTLGGNSDGRRANNVVERYRTGTPNEPISGETASE